MISISDHKFKDWDCELIHSNTWYCEHDYIVTDLMFILTREVNPTDRVHVNIGESVELNTKLVPDNKIVKDILSPYLYKPLIDICCSYTDQLYTVDMKGKWYDTRHIGGIFLRINDKLDGNVEFFSNCITNTSKSNRSCI